MSHISCILLKNSYPQRKMPLKSKFYNFLDPRASRATIETLRFIRERIRERELVINIDPFKNIDSCHVFYLHASSHLVHQCDQRKLQGQHGSAMCPCPLSLLSAPIFRCLMDQDGLE